MRLALDTPRRRAAAAAGLVLAAGALWSVGTGGQAGALLLLPLFYPYLLGHLPSPVVWPLSGVFAAVAWASWRARKRHRAAFAVFGYACLALALLGWGRLCESAKTDWTAWHMGGAGLRAGMLRAEVEQALARRASVESCTPGGCAYRPAGLASRAFSLFERHGVDTEYGPDGRLERWQAWSD